MTEELIDYDKELESGKYLFKFCRFDLNALQIIISKTLYFSAPNKLNDPLDSKLKLNISQEKYISEKTIQIMKNSGFRLNEADLREILLEEKEPINYATIRILLRSYFEHLQNNYTGICCFSTNIKDKNLMWSHYADEARGLCLVFDKEKLIESLSNKLIDELRSGEYRLYKRKIVYEGIKPLEVQVKESGELICQFDYPFSKAKHWSSEEEYRLILEKFGESPIEFDQFGFYPFMVFDDECLKYIVGGDRLLFQHIRILEQLRDKEVFKAKLLYNKLED